MSSPEPSSPAHLEKSSGPLEPPALYVWFTQNLRLILLGLPCVLVVALACIAGFSVIMHREGMVVQYLAAADLGVQSKDYDRARVALERVLSQGTATDELTFKLGQVHELMGHHDRALGLIAPLAPVGEPGSGPAQLTMASWLLARADQSASDQQEAEAHLRQAVASMPTSTAAHAMLGQLYARTGRNSLAKAALLVAVKERPELLLQVAALSRADGDESQALNQAREALKLFSDRSSRRPDDLNARLLSADAALFLRDYERAVTMLTQGVARENSPRLQRALAAVYLTWADQLTKDGKTPIGGRLSLLERGLSHEPDNTALIDRFLEILKAGGNDAVQTREALTRLLADGTAPASAHFLLGVDAWQQDHKPEARMHWERAYALAPQFKGVLNNLAWALSESSDPADLARGLDLINLALEKPPIVRNYLGTRGRILLHLQRWKEAVADLEAALAAAPGNANLHSDLAKAYSALGFDEIAHEHQSRVPAQPAQP